LNPRLNATVFSKCPCRIGRDVLTATTIRVPGTVVPRIMHASPFTTSGGNSIWSPGACWMVETNTPRGAQTAAFGSGAQGAHPPVVRSGREVAVGEARSRQPLVDEHAWKPGLRETSSR